MANEYEIAVKHKKLPEYSYPEAHPIFYVTKSHFMLCGKCASKSPKSIVNHEINWHDPIECDECNKEISGAYDVES